MILEVYILIIILLEVDVKGNIGNFSSFLITILKEGSISGIPLIFILNHFDGFIHRTKQTLLYQLFDLIQNENSRLALVGITNSIDNVQSMEKRIVSRFSRLQIVIPRLSLDNILKIIQSSLELPSGNGLLIKCKNNFNEIFNDNNKQFYGLLERRYKCGFTLPYFLNFVLLLLTNLRENHPEITSEDIIESDKILTGDIHLEYIKDLTEIELIIMIGSLVLLSQQKYPLTLQMVKKEYEEYNKDNESVIRSVENYTTNQLIIGLRQLYRKGLISSNLTSNNDNSNFYSNNTQTVHSPFRLTVDPTVLFQYMKENHDILKINTHLCSWLERASTN